MICNVAHCLYTAVGDVEAFPVCGLHDGPHTRAMLMDLKRPGHFWCHDRPIILPVGELTEDHFAPIDGDGLDPEECPLLAEINFECHSSVLPQFDLTKEYAP